MCFFLFFIFISDFIFLAKLFFFLNNFFLVLKHILNLVWSCDTSKHEDDFYFYSANWTTADDSLQEVVRCSSCDMWLTTTRSWVKLEAVNARVNKRVIEKARRWFFYGQLTMKTSANHPIPWGQLDCHNDNSSSEQRKL